MYSEIAFFIVVIRSFIYCIHTLSRKRLFGLESYKLDTLLINYINLSPKEHKLDQIMTD